MVRRPTPSSLAASVSDSPNDLRHSAKSAPVIGCCSSAIRRSVDAERSRRPHFVWTGQPMPRPSSTIATLPKVSASSSSGLKCALRAISPVRSISRSRRSPAKRTRRTRPPAGRAFVTLAMSSVMSPLPMLAPRIRLEGVEYFRAESGDIGNIARGEGQLMHLGCRGKQRIDRGNGTLGRLCVSVARAQSS